MPKSDKFLVLDLDKTLIRTFEPYEAKPKRKANFNIGSFPVYMRPGLEEFLAYCKNNFTLGVWSNGTGLYVDDVVETLFKEGDLEFQLCYTDCSFPPEGIKENLEPELRDKRIIKDLNLLSIKRVIPLSKTIVIDDEPLHYLEQDSIIPIKPWHGEEEDFELRIVQQFLSCIVNNPGDLRKELKHYRTYRDYSYSIRSA